jgi:hypothetical protein
MNNKMTKVLSSPLFPLKGRFDTNLSSAKLATTTPLRGQGVSKYDNTFLP